MKFFFDILNIFLRNLLLIYGLVAFLTFPLGLFGYSDKVINNKMGTINLLFLPYLFGYNFYISRFYNKVPFGFYCFIGEQGSGKTLSMVYNAHKLKKKDYNCFYSNMQSTLFS